MYQEYLNQLRISINPLSTDELKDLLNNDEKLDEKVDSVLEVLKTQKDNIFKENIKKAEENIEKEPMVLELKSKVSELTEEGKQHCESVQTKIGEIKAKSGDVNQESALALLQTSAAESEEASENLVTRFKDNDLSVEAFIEEFLATRKQMHLRKLKAEKMQDLIRGHARGSIPGRPTYSNVPSGSFYPTPYPPQAGGSTGLPYPMGAMMPMPPSRYF